MAQDAEGRPQGWWRVDLHTHTWASRDCLTDPAALISRARRIGLDRVAVTDHNTIEGALAAQKLAPDLVIVGEEIKLAGGGELIAYFVRECVPGGLEIGEVISRLRDQGAIISVSHPLDRHRRRSALGERRVLDVIDQVDALETFNARCLSAEDNQRAAALAEQYQRAITAGSDAHTLGEVGAGYLALPPFGADSRTFLTSLALAQAGGRLSGIWPHFATTYARAAKRWRQGD